jgi:hypothetical protein
MMMSLMGRIFPLVVLSVIVSGCDARQAQVTTLRIEDVPPNLMEIAREKLPGVTFDTAWKKASGTFEIRGKAKNGKIREVDIRPDGTVEEVE